MGEASVLVEAEVAIVEVVGGDKHLEATGGDWQRSLATLRQEVRGRQWERCAATVGSPRNAKLEHREFRQDTARLLGGNWRGSAALHCTCTITLLDPRDGHR